ncbi:MAG: branched-chain amino acid ABC transporter permease, partial [Pseudomonadota bacterium]
MTRDLRSAAAPWLIAAAVLLALPHLFGSNSAITIMNQMAITIVFALSYNMLLGQAGMLSFGHAVYLGLGGYFAIYTMNWLAGSQFPIPLPFLPIFGGLFSLGIAIIIGAFSLRRSGMVFAMISLGIVELVSSYAIITYGFFNGGGVGGDRTFMVPFLGVEFLHQRQIYYIVASWMLLSAWLMFLFTRTVMGRMANAVRDNPERAEFVGYSAYWVRFCSFCAAGFFAGVAGSLFAVTYEITTVENMNLQASGTILMVTFLGGVGYFIGPVLGAVLFTLLQTVLSLHTDLWQLYLGVLFLLAVMFFPNGLAGVLAMHAPILRSGRLAGLIVPYL